jgi:hypothetical protein
MNQNDMVKQKKINEFETGKDVGMGGENYNTVYHL